MSKFEKKIKKIIKKPENAMVVGNGFSLLSDILLTHTTVFIIESSNQETKSKNLVYRENFEYLNMLYDVRIIYFDLDKLHHLETLKDFWKKHKSYIIIEGGEPIGRKLSKPLYDTGWGCTLVEKHFHVWEKVR